MFRPDRRVRKSISLRLEILEDRTVPSILVNNLADTGAGSLRQAITTANGTAALDVIMFDPKLAGVPIVLTSAGLPTITQPLTIQGLGQNLLTVSGNDLFRVFDIAAGTPVTLTDMNITRGKAPDPESGGGVRNAGTLTLSRVTVSACSSFGIGGGIGNSAGATVTLIGCQLVSNRVTAAGAGGMSNTGGTATVLESTVAGNVALGGGGLGNLNNGTLNIIQSTVFGNGSTGGGGVLNFSGTLNITNSTIVNNLSRSGGGGGGVLVLDGAVTIVNSTIAFNGDTSNDAQGAGGIAKGATGTVTLLNSIVSQNFAGPASIDNNVELADLNTNSFNFIGGDPKLGPLQFNGSPTKTMVPLPGSPVIDAGSNALVPLLTIDQRGFNRRVDGDQNGTKLIDQGAAEFTPGPPGVIAVGADLGGAPELKIYDLATNALRYDFTTYESTFQGGIRVAVGDLTGDGVPDYVVAPGGVNVTLVNVNGGLFPQFDVSRGRVPEMKVFSGVNGLRVFDFLAYDSSFKAGVFVAVGDINHDGKVDIITAPEATGQSGHTNVRVFFNNNLINNGGTLVPDREFNAYDPGFGGGVRLAVGDLNNDGFADIVTAPGIWSGPDIRVFDGQGLANSSTAVRIGEFLAYDFRYFGGVFASIGDVNGDRKPDIVTGTNGNGGPEVKAFSGANILSNPNPTIVDDFFAYDPAFNGGARVAVVDVNRDGKADIVTGTGPGSTALVRIFDGGTGLQLQTSPLDNFLAFDVLLSGGVFVGGQ